MAPKTPAGFLSGRPPGNAGSGGRTPGKPVKDSDTPAEMARDKKRGITETMETNKPPTPKKKSGK